MPKDSMSLTDHLEELRQRVWIVFSSIAVFSIISFYWSPQMISWISSWAGELVFLTPAEAFLARLKVAFFCGTMASLPVILFEIWRFIALGLKPQERLLLRFFIPFSYALFLGGSALAVFVVGPKAMGFLIAFGGDGLHPMLTISSVLKFLFFLSLAFGLTFEMPIAILILNRLGIIDRFRLSNYRRVIYLGIVVTAAVLTPGPDIISQLLLAFPMIILFEISLLLLRWQEKARSKDLIPPLPDA